MAAVISFISRKGGTGKTTNAINLATMLDNLGRRVVLIETDTNYTLTALRKLDLYKTSAKAEGLFEVLGSNDAEVLDVLQELQAKDTYDFIIVDSAGKTTDTAIKRLCMESHLVIVPTSLTQNDMLVTYQTIEDLKPAQAHNPQLQIVVLPNRVHSSTKISTIKETLSDLNAHILDHRVPAKNAFANFSTLMPEKGYLETAKEILSLLEK